MPVSASQPLGACIAQVGIGAFVLNERREVLVVQEKLGPLRGTGVWKMPTGLVQVSWPRGTARLG